MKAKERMYEQIEQHGKNLQAIFNLEGDPVVLCKKLHSLEHKARKLSLDYCNGTNGITTENWEEKTAPILKAVRTILNCSNTFPIFVNGDARGYALKIRDEHMRKYQHLNGYDRLHTDLGGYGIISPEFDGKGACKMNIERIKDFGGYADAMLNGGTLNCYRRYHRLYCKQGNDYYYATDRFNMAKEQDKGNIEKLDKFFSERSDK